MERKLTTIVAMDVGGYSRLMERDEEGTLGRLKEIRGSIVDPVVPRHAGRTVKLMGDGTLLEFVSVVGAVTCAVEIQEALASRNAFRGGNHKVQLRIGLHLGDVIVEDGDIYGDGVNVASRLESIAPAGGIVLSQQVYDHIGGNVPVTLVPLGEQVVKNISRPIEAYRIELDGQAVAADTIRFGGFELDTAQYELRESGRRVGIEPQVFDLLVYLARNADRTVTKEEIFAEIWRGRIVSDAALSSQIKAARKVLGDDGTAQHTIRTIHGRGFRFVAPLATPAPEAAPINASVPEAEADGGLLAALVGKPTLAVLPFSNLNRDADEDYFADGISEDLITALSKYRWLTVIARNPAFAFRSAKDGIRAIGQKLGADYIVTGSVRKAGTRARITVQLVDAKTENSI